MKSIIIGDLHLGRSLSIGKPAENGKLNSRFQDQLDLLDWIYDRCVEQDIKEAIFTGDIFQDFKPHPAVIAMFLRFIKKGEKAGIRFHFIFGNHDIIRSGQYVTSALDIVPEIELSHANVYKDFSRVDLDGVTFVFIPFKDKRMYEVKTTEEAIEKFKQELADVCKEPTGNVKIAVGHMALDGSLAVGDEIADQLNEIMVSAEMMSWFDYVWMGHIHHPQVLQHENPYMAHVGSLDRSDFSKTEISINKKVIIIDSESKEFFKEQFLPNRTLLPVKITVPSDKDSTDFVINELCLLSKNVDFTEAIVRLEIELAAAELENVDREKIKSYIINNLEAHHICDFSESRTFSSIEAISENQFDNTMSFSYSIQKWADKQTFESDEERELFNLYSDEVIKEYEEKLKK